MVVQVEGLRMRYGSVDVLDDVSFHVGHGQVVALLGPNGAGKTTTIEILEGFRRRSGGRVEVLGTDPAHGDERWRARVGVVLQSWRDHGRWRVRELLAHLGSYYAPYSTPGITRPWDTDGLLAAVGLTDQAHEEVRRLSGGQRRRLDVALGIVGRPELLFLDEPTTGFDPEARRQFWELIRGLSSEGASILLTTHYLDEAAQLADRAGIIAGGELVALGAVDELGGADARIPVVRWIEDGVLREERTTEPGQLVARLSAAGEPERLEVIRPSLEDIYLELVGETQRASALPEGTLA